MSFPIFAYSYVSPQGKSCTGQEAETPCVGLVQLRQDSEDVCVIDYHISGLTPGDHGFHIHEKADFSNGCTSAGPHYNPFGLTHGGPSDQVRHVGDLGNIAPNESGVAAGQIVDNQVKLFGEHSVIGRSFMVHADPDDLGKGGSELSPTTGNAGARIACGAIIAFPLRATCTVSPQGKPCSGQEEQTPCTGVITLIQETPDQILIEYEISGLSQGLHGFHIHEKADFSNGCTSAGPHYNPFKQTHGAPEDEVRHVGDLGNISPDEHGVARGQIRDPLVKLFGETSVIGRSFMVHADPDDLGKGGHELSLTTGNAGARIACGEIVWA